MALSEMHIQTSKKVPMRQFKGTSSDAVGGAVPFYYAGSHRPGLRLFDAASMTNPAIMARPNELAVPNYSTIRLHVTWPGYSKSAITVPINCRQSKAAFAVAVARQIIAFLQKCATIPCSSSYADWQVGPRSMAISLSKVVLVAVVQTGGDVWQADLELEV